MLYATRTYANAAGNTIRVDSIIMEPTNTWTNASTESRTYYRRLRTVPTYITGAGRVVATITFETNADAYEAVTGDFEWATWSTHGAARCDMSDLPGVGDTV